MKFSFIRLVIAVFLSNVLCTLPNMYISNNTDRILAGIFIYFVVFVIVFTTNVKAKSAQKGLDEARSRVRKSG